MGDDITIGVTEITNLIEVTSQPNDQIIDIGVTDNTDNVTINVTPSVIEINIIKGTGGGGSGAVSSVNGYIGDVVLTKTDLGLGNVDNTSDLDKPISTATQSALDLKVPYTGATSNVNLGEFQLITGQITFDQTPTQSAGVGVMRWNDTDGTLDLGLKGGNVTLQLGQEQVVRIVNKTGSNLTEAGYQAVYTSGAQGQRLKVDLALANSDLTSAGTLGIVTENIAVNQEGFVTTNGLVRGVNTTGSLQGETWSDGDILYLSPIVAGRITNIKPIAPQHLVVIGVCVYAHITQGSIFVKVDNGYELDELHNVLITSIANNEGLFYETSTGLFKNKSISTVLGYTPVSNALTISTTSPLNGGGDLSANRTLSISQSNTTTNGYLSSTDWNTFNNKQSALSGTGFVKSTAGVISYDTNSYYLASNPNGYTSNLGTVTSVSMTVPTGLSVSGSPITSIGTLGLSFTTGYSIPTDANQTNWTTAYTNRITSLTTTGSSGVSTLLSNVLNIPNYTLSGLGGQPLDADLTAIAGLAGTSGFLKKTATDTWTLDTNNYLTSAVTTLSGGTTGLTPSSATSGAITLAGTLIVGNGGTGSTTAEGARTNLGATTIGANIFTSTNPTAITFLRANADNTVSWLDAATFRTAIGAGTSTVTPSALTKVDDTNVTLTLGGTPATALLQGVSLTLGWTGTLADGRIASAATWNSKQAALSGTGIVKSTAGVISYLTDNSTNWDSAYTNRITSLTTTGSSGASTLISNVLNIPTYTLSGLGGQVSSTNLTSLSGLTFASTSFVKMTSAGTFALDTTAYTSNLGTITSVAAITLGTTGTDLSSTVATGTTTPVITLNVPTASSTNRGALSSADWSTFNGKQNALTNPITGTGTTNYLPKFTGTSTLGNSLMFENTSGMEIFKAVGSELRLSNGNNTTTIKSVLVGADSDMTFNTQTNTERMRITNLGNILIGTTTDDGINKLQINGYSIATGYKVPSGTSAQYLMADGSVSSGGSGGVGTTNLSYTASSTNGIVVSDTGTDATLPLANGTNAGLLSPSGFTNLSNAILTSGNQSISGQKGFSSAGTPYSVSIITNDGTAGLYVGNSLGNYGIYGDNTSTGIGAYISNSSTGQALVLNNTTAGTGMPFSVRKNSVDALTISDNGSIDILGTNADITMKGITTEPATPSADSLTLYAKKIGGKMVLKTKDEYGVDFSLQNSFWDNNITYWSNTNATAGVWEGTVGAGAGTFTQALPTTTSIYTSIKRARYANVVTTTNQVLGQRNTEAMYFRGGLAGIGGFFFYARFGFDVWTNGSRLFAGFHSGTTVISADPSALNNTMGFCVDAADNGLISFLTRGTAATKSSTGFTITTGKGYDVYMYAAPNGSTIYWKIEDLNAGTEVSGSATLNLPTNTTMLTAGVLASNAALTTVTATQLGINKIYIETDY